MEWRKGSLNLIIQALDGSLASEVEETGLVRAYMAIIEANDVSFQMNVNDAFRNGVEDTTCSLPGDSSMAQSYGDSMHVAVRCPRV